jgi:hypothetical protein
MGQIRAHHARQPRHGGRESAKRSWVCIRLCLNARGRESAHTSARLAPQRSLFIGTHAPLPTQRADPAASGRARCIQGRVSIPGSAWERSRRARGRIASTTRLAGHMALWHARAFAHPARRSGRIWARQMHPETGIHTGQRMGALQARSRAHSEHHPPRRAHGASPEPRFLALAPHSRGAQCTHPPARHTAWRTSGSGSGHAASRRPSCTSASTLFA